MLTNNMPGLGNQVKQFGTDYINSYNSTAGANLMTKVDEYVNAYQPSKETEFDINTMPTTVQQYLAAFATKCNEISTILNGDNVDPALKTAYGQNAKELVQYFMQDIKNGALLTQTIYTGDFEKLKTFVNDRLVREQINNNNNSGRHQFNPRLYRDKGVPQVTRERMEVKVSQGGIQGDNNTEYAQYGTENANLYVNMSIKDLVDKVNNSFGNGYLQSEVDWYTATWNNETNITQSQVDVFNTTNSLYSLTSEQQANYEANVNQSLNISEYGNLSGESALTVANNYSMLDNLYNNRNYGYRFAEGVPYNTVSVTVGNRKYQLYDQFYESPLVLDLNGDGKLEASKGEWLPHKYENAKLVEFDIDGDQFVELTEWVGPNDGLLLVGYEKGKDINANHLFGEAGGYKNGYEKLSLFDTNGDKQISGDELKTLSVWQDQNGNGKVDDGEVVAVTELGITSISLTHEQLVSSFVQKGETRKLWDWYPTYFRLKKTPN